MKNIISAILSFMLLLNISVGATIKSEPEIVEKEPLVIVDTIDPGEFVHLDTESYDEEEEEIRNEIMYGELELLAILVYAEAGNQDELGQRYVADTVLNRVDDKDFPDTIEEVIYQREPTQYFTSLGKCFDKLSYEIPEEIFDIVYQEYIGPRKNYNVLYFRTGHYGSGTPMFKHGDHYFSGK